MNKKNIKRKPTTVDHHIGKQLKYIRIKKGLSQASLAKFIGVTFQQLQKYEQGQNRISASTLYKLSQMLEVSPMSFFEGLSLKHEPFRDELITDKIFIALFGTWKRIQNPETKLRFKKLMEDVAEKS